MTESAQTDRDLMTVAGLTLHVGGVTLIEGLDLRIAAGQSWSVLGRNGAGKTTLLKALAGLRDPDGGSIAFQGRPLRTLKRREVARRIGLLFQEYRDTFPATVLETVLTGRHPHLHAWQWESPTDLSIARDALTQVALTDFEHRTLDSLSGGERRRVAIATLLAQAPILYLLDEPSNHLDLHHQTELLRALTRSITGSGGTLVMSLHDVNLAARLSDHCLLLLPGGASAQGRTTDVLSAKSLERVYGQPFEEIQGRRGRVWVPE